MNVIERLEFELANFNSAIHRFNHYTTRIYNKVTEHCNPNDSNSCNDSCNYRLGDNDINSNKKSKHRKTKVIWFNSTFSNLSNINKADFNYIGISARNWKKRVYNYGRSFSSPLLRNQTALLGWFWSLRDRGVTPQIKWGFIKDYFIPESFNSRCNLYFFARRKK